MICWGIELLGLRLKVSGGSCLYFLLQGNYFFSFGGFSLWGFFSVGFNEALRFC